MIDLVIAASRFLPDLGIRSSMAAVIKTIRPGISETKYASACLLIPLPFAILVAFSSILFALVTFAFFAYTLLLLPSSEARKKAECIEAELPFFLRELGLLLNMKLRFNDALTIAAEEKGELEKTISMLGSQMDSGASFPQSLSAMVRGSTSSQLKRSASALLSAYETGEASGLLSLSDELLLLQKHKTKDASSRFSLFGILFIVLAALAPTFFLVYFVLGGSILSAQIPDSLFVLGMLVLFPLLSILVLLMAKVYSPSIATSNLLTLNPFTFFKNESKKEELEKMLPDALIAISAIPLGAATETAFIAVAKGGYGKLSDEFNISLKQLRSKIPLDKVLKDLGKRNSSPMLSRACSLLSYAFSTNHFSSVARLAEDFLVRLELTRERANVFSIHKYTLFFGALLVPAILSIALALCTEMTVFTGGKPLSVLVYPVIYVYLFIYAAMVAWFSADAEGKRSLAVVYFPALLATSLITFNAIKLI